MLSFETFANECQPRGNATTAINTGASQCARIGFVPPVVALLPERAQLKKRFLRQVAVSPPSTSIFPQHLRQNLRRADSEQHSQFPPS